MNQSFPKIWIIIITILVLLCVGGGIFLYQSQQKILKEIIRIKEPSISKSPEETLKEKGLKQEEAKTPEEKPITSIKYSKERLPSFKDFPVSEKFEGQPAPVDFSTNPKTLKFFTVITEGAKKGPNFAGHYTVIKWGCGTGCQAGVIVDAKTGAISSFIDEGGNISPFFVSSLGTYFRIDSNLFILNPLEEIQEVYETWPVLDYIYTIYYKWENNQLVKIFDTKSLE